MRCDSFLLLARSPCSRWPAAAAVSRRPTRRRTIRSQRRGAFLRKSISTTLTAIARLQSTKDRFTSLGDEAEIGAMILGEMGPPGAKRYRCWSILSPPTSILAPWQSRKQRSHGSSARSSRTNRRGNPIAICPCAVCSCARSVQPAVPGGYHGGMGESRLRRLVRDNSAAPIDAARVVAWVLAVGAVGAVAICYDLLPATLPVTRWTSAPKSLSTALRVPLINLITVGLIEVVSPGFRRAKDFDVADAVVATLFLTAAGKAAIEAAGILMLPVPPTWTLIPLVVVLSVGLSRAAFLGRELLHPQCWRQVRMTRLECAGALCS